MDGIRAKADAVRKLVDSVDDSILGKVAHAIPLIGTWGAVLDRIVDVLDDVIDYIDEQARGVAGVVDPAPTGAEAGPGGTIPPTVK
jgi:hypothetical protein